ncbi:MAG: glycosyltransferase [Pseudomonas sp.]
MSKIVGVTVTYGQRSDYLYKVIDGLRAQGVSSLVVVDNGARWAVKETLETRYAGFVSVVPMGRNQGSAAGYAAGLRYAASSDADFIFLLDDDNLPRAGCISTLLDAHARLQQSSQGPLALLAFRPEHQPDVAAGVPASRVNLRNNSFRGFHLKDVPYKLLRRLHSRKPGPGTIADLVKMDIAPYSGMFFRRELIDQIGLPKADFVLYTDDSEFTYRVTHAGGRIMLVTKAQIDDLETSWNTRKETKTTSFDIVLNQGSDLRVYYGTRNGVYFGRYCRPSNRLVSWLNRETYMALLRLKALRAGKTARYGLVRRAVQDGLAKRLGEHPEFPLP